MINEQTVKLKVASTSVEYARWGEITGNIESQTDLMNMLGERDLDDVQEAITQGLSDIDTAKEEAIEEIRQSGGGLTADVKNAILNCFQKVAWVDENGQTYYDSLYNALYPPVEVRTLTAVLDASGHTFYVGDSIEDLRTYLTVTAELGTGQTVTVNDYTLSGTLVAGTSTITVVYGSKTTTFTVNVVSLSSIDAVYTQSGVVSDSASLDSLKTDLVVTATLSNGDIYTVPSTDYTLSGTLEGGTSVITVTYQGLTDTFNVTVTEIIDYTLNPLENVTWYDGYSYNNNTGVMSATAGEHCTSKFTLQNCAYLFSNGDTTNNRYPAIFAWNENGEYLGRIQVANLYMLKKGYTYAVKAYNTGTFDSSTISLMPKDNSSTAVPPFQIDLGANIASITASGTSHYELNVSSIMSTAGVTAGNMASKLNKCNFMALLYPTNKSFFDNADFTFCWYNINTLQFKVKDVGVNLDNLATYLASNNIVIRFND